MHHIEQPSRQDYHLIDTPQLRCQAEREQVEFYAAVARWIVKNIQDISNRIKFTGPLSPAGH